MKKITHLMLLLVAGSVAAQEDCNLQYDGNGDGAVNVEDVLGVLSEFGEVCEPGFVNCGDNISFYGYSYSTVLIGDQCWFAENLRTEVYTNGDSIPSNLPDSVWTSTTSGAVAVYGEGQSACVHSSPDGNACDPTWSLNEYGRLYNWYAVDDERGLCPTGWHVPNDEEWTVLTDFFGGEAVAGENMKSNYGWYGEGNGSNSSGFSGLPSGHRVPLFGFFQSAGIWGDWYSSSLIGSWAWGRALHFDGSAVYRNQYILRTGCSIRCIKD